MVRGPPHSLVPVRLGLPPTRPFPRFSPRHTSPVWAYGAFHCHCAATRMVKAPAGWEFQMWPGPERPESSVLLYSHAGAALGSASTVHERPSWTSAPAERSSRITRGAALSGHQFTAPRPSPGLPGPALPLLRCPVLLPLMMPQGRCRCSRAASLSASSRPGSPAAEATGCNRESQRKLLSDNTNTPCHGIAGVGMASCCRITQTHPVITVCRGWEGKSLSDNTNTPCMCW